MDTLFRVRDYAEQIAANRPKAYAALDVMENHLKNYSFLATGRYTIADAGLYAYTHVARQSTTGVHRYGLNQRPPDCFCYSAQMR